VADDPEALAEEDEQEKARRRTLGAADVDAGEGHAAVGRGGQL